MINAAWLAANWFFANVEISNPSGSIATRKAEATPTSAHTEPRSGTSKMNTAVTVVIAIATMPMKK